MTCFEKMSSIISRIKVKIGKFSTLNYFLYQSSWMHFKFCRCIFSDAPSTNQVLSISLQTTSRCRLLTCSSFCLRMAISSGVEAFFRFFEMAAAFALAKALLSLICSSNIKLLSFTSRVCLNVAGGDSRVEVALVFPLLWRSSFF